MEQGFLRFSVTLIKPDGSERVLEHEATPSRCGVLERKHKRLVALGSTSKLRFRVSKVL